MNSNKTSTKQADTKVEAKTKNTDARYNWYGVTEENLANEKIPDSRYKWYGVTPDDEDLSYGVLKP